MKRLLLILGIATTIATTSLPVSAQRKTDVLGRGLVAVKKTGGVFLSWRIPAGNTTMWRTTSIATARC